MSFERANAAVNLFLERLTVLEWVCEEFRGGNATSTVFVQTFLDIARNIELAKKMFVSPGYWFSRANTLDGHAEVHRAIIKAVDMFDGIEQRIRAYEQERSRKFENGHNLIKSVSRLRFLLEGIGGGAADDIASAGLYYIVSGTNGSADETQKTWWREGVPVGLRGNAAGVTLVRYRFDNDGEGDNVVIVLDLESMYADIAAL